MSNTNNMRPVKHTMNEQTLNIDLPPIFPDEILSRDSRVCEKMHLYLAVWGDLTPEQRRPVLAHVQICEQCTYERQLYWGSTRTIVQLPETQPSARVDRAVMEAIAARSRGNSSTRAKLPKAADASFGTYNRSVPPVAFAPRASRPVPILRRRSTHIATLVAILVLTLLSSTYFIVNSHSGSSHAPQTATITLPANLSWDKYVLYQEQSMTGSQGQSYTMTSYNDMATQDANIEVVVPGKMDLVVLKDTKQTLGLDMMHHVAQWNSPTWVQSDTSLFDLSRLRQYLSSGQATYLGTSLYQGQQVYRIHMPNSNVLLLDSHYLPVNVLANVDSSGNGKPVYSALRWMLPSQVPPSTWNMAVPGGFSMGTLPSQP